MKKNCFALISVALMLLTTACSVNDEKEVEVDARGIPMSVSSLILGDSCTIDTLYATEDNVYRIIFNTDYAQTIMFDNNGLLAYNPVLRIDTISESEYRFFDLVKSVKVDFKDAKCVDEIKRTFPVYDGFDLVTFGECRRTPQLAVFSLSASMANEKIKNYEDINRWNASEIDTLSFDGSIRNFANAIATDYFAEFPEKITNYMLYENYSNTAYWMTSKYVTYFDMFTFFTGGAHGLYGYEFRTYLFEENAPVTFEYMFNADNADQIRELIYEAIAQDVDFMTNHKFNSTSQVKNFIEENLNGEELNIPDPGLLDEGVVFCYQPYELSSYADGAFQLVISYGKLAPYMTEKGKRLMR